MSMPQLPDGLEWCVTYAYDGKATVRIVNHDRIGALTSAVANLKNCANEDEAVAVIHATAVRLWSEQQREMSLRVWVEKNFGAA